MVAYLFPFLEPSPPYSFHPTLGLNLFFFGFFFAFLVPTGILYLAAFSLPLIAAFFGLVYQIRDTYRASVVSTASAVLGFAGLVTGYIIDSADRLAFGYFAAAAALLVAMAATSFRLIGGSRLRKFERQTRWGEIEPAASANQEALNRSRNT